MRLIFLDVDGVLNDHKPFPNGYCGLVPRCVANLCRILEEVPDARIVISSAWRYMIPDGFTLKGFEYLLCIYGAQFETVSGRVIGITERDEETYLRLGLMEPDAHLDYEWLKENGCEIRAIQIETYAGDTPFIVLDDLWLPVAGLIQTHPALGLASGDAMFATFALQETL